AIAFFKSVTDGFMSLHLLVQPIHSQIVKQGTQHRRDSVGGLLKDARIGRGEAATLARLALVNPAKERQQTDRPISLQSEGQPDRFDRKILGERFPESMSLILYIWRQAMRFFIRKHVGDVLWRHS